MAHAGLRKEVRTVRGKKGTVKRTYWVKAQQGVAPVGTRNPGKPAGMSKPVVSASATRMSTGQFLKKHGAQIALRGVAQGAATASGQILGHRAGHKALGNLGATIGGFVAAQMAGRQAVKRVYAGKRGREILSDARNATAGAKISGALIHGTTSLATHIGGLRVYNRLNKSP